MANVIYHLQNWKIIIFICRRLKLEGNNTFALTGWAELFPERKENRQCLSPSFIASLRFDDIKIIIIDLFPL